MIALLLLWLPFQAVSDMFTDVWRILVKWNQYVREYESTALGTAEESGSRPAPNTANPFAEAASQVTASPQRSAASQELPPYGTQGDFCKNNACRPVAMMLRWWVDIHPHGCVHDCPAAMEHCV